MKLLSTFQNLRVELQIDVYRDRNDEDIHGVHSRSIFLDQGNELLGDVFDAIQHTAKIEKKDHQQYWFEELMVRGNLILGVAEAYESGSFKYWCSHLNLPKDM